MAAKTMIGEGHDLDFYIEQFEAAQRSETASGLDAYLPNSSDPVYSDVLSELIRVDLEYRWKSGRPKSLQKYAEEFPEFFRDRRQVEAVAYEEFRLRRQHGDAVSAEEYESRLGIDSTSWPARCSSLLHSGTSRAGAHLNGPHLTQGGSRMPEEGESFLGFTLIGELGRGAFGTVFLAQQGDLAQRPVALKISRELFAESQALAQLQHTNIVPIYSVHRAGALQAVCMPFFGATTLAHVLGHWKEQGSLPPSGKALVETVVNQASTIRSAVSEKRGMRRLSVSTHKTGTTPDRVATLQDLAGLNYVEAVLWIGARLADGLSHAHQRGILHQDLKPANVLLADDGRPMLLDFNLSQDTKRQSSAGGVGGTLPYMAPEHLLALRDGVASSDSRSDVYSLGVILFEMLAGDLPYPRREGKLADVIDQMLQDRRSRPSGLRRRNTAVTPAVEAILFRCLGATPERRYQSAAELQEDLDRQLKSLPLKHVAEPSLVERTRKWLRRHPRLTSASSVAIGAIAAIVLLTALLSASLSRLASLDAAANYDGFSSDMRSAQLAALDAAAAGLDHNQEIDSIGRRALARYSVLVDDKWRQSRRVSRLPVVKQEQLAADVGELLFLMAAVDALDAEALHDRAWTCYRPGKQPAALIMQRRKFKPAAAVEDFLPSASWDSISARDQGMSATLSSLEHRFREALPHWQAATSLDPQNAWAWFGLGVCYEQLSQPQHAASAFTACISLKPNHGEWYFHRGTAYLKQQEVELATRDFDRALEFGNDRKELRVNRGLAYLGQNLFGQATAELEQCLKISGEDYRVYSILAQVRAKSGDAAGAKLAREKAQTCKPTDDASWVARGVALVGTDPQVALQCFDRALVENSHCVAALENKAHVFAEKVRDPQQAIEALDRAIQLYPERALLYASRGIVRARMADDSGARDDAAKALALDNSDSIRYQVAGVHALLSRQSPADRQEALQLLSSALRHGYGTALVEDDIDLAPLRGDPRLIELVAAAKALDPVSRAAERAAKEGSD